MTNLSQNFLVYLGKDTNKINVLWFVCFPIGDDSLPFFLRGGLFVSLHSQADKDKDHQ